MVKRLDFCLSARGRVVIYYHAPIEPFRRRPFSRFTWYMIHCLHRFVHDESIDDYARVGNHSACRDGVARRYSVPESFQIVVIESAKEMCSIAQGLDLQRQIVLYAHLFYLIQLCLIPVDVAFFLQQDRFEKFACAIIISFHAGLDAFVVGFHR